MPAAQQTFTTEEIGQITAHLEAGLTPEKIADLFEMTRPGFVNRLENTGYVVEIYRRLKPRTSHKRLRNTPFPPVQTVQTVAEL